MIDIAIGLAVTVVVGLFYLGLCWARKLMDDGIDL